MLGNLFHFLRSGLSNSADYNANAGSPRCSVDGVKIHAPSQVNLRVSGTYISVLPDTQVAQVVWDSGLKTIEYADGSVPGFADTVLSANTLSLSSGSSVDWNLHDLSGTNNVIGHGVDATSGYGKGNLGDLHCTSRIYAMFIKNKDTSVGNLKIGNAASNKWTSILSGSSTVTLPADSVFVIASEDPSGFAVTGGSSCNLRAKAESGGVNYSLNWVGQST
jgi:hypothetical protein